MGGFMLEHARDGLYGKALYFAASPCYSQSASNMIKSRSHRTTEVDGVTHYHMLMCRVLCGVCKRMGGSINRAFNRVTLTAEDYDSVEGGPHSPGCTGPGRDDSIMYAIYKPQQAYPEFVVTYRALRPGEEPLPIV